MRSIPDQCEQDGDCEGPWAELHQCLTEDPTRACDICKFPLCVEDGEWPECGGPYDNEGDPLEGAQPEGDN